MNPQQMTVEDAINSLTGFEEMAIEKHMGVDIYDVLGKPVLLNRVLIFVDQQRQGLKPAEAVQHARSMTSKAVIAYFEPDPEEVDPDEPETPAGEGHGPVGPEQPSSLPSVSSPESAPAITPI